MALMIDHHPQPWFLFLIVVALFFGGMKLADGWYGQRCLRLLNLQSY